MESYQDPEWLRQKYWGEGLSCSNIAALVGRTKQVIWKWMKRHGIPRRTMSEAKRKNGRVIEGDGRIRILAPDNPMADSRGYVREHRLIMSQILGRTPGKREAVHHINGRASDNRPKNLRLFASVGEHMAHHHALRRRRHGSNG